MTTRACIVLVCLIGCSSGPAAHSNADAGVARDGARGTEDGSRADGPRADGAAPDGARADGPRGGDAALLDGPRAPDGPPRCAPNAALPPAPMGGLVLTTETAAVLAGSGEMLPPMPLALLAGVTEPAEADLTPALHVSTPNASCPRLVHFVNPAIAIPTGSTIRKVEAYWEGQKLQLFDPGRSEVAEEAHSYGEMLPFWKPLFSLEGIPAGRGALEVRGLDASGAMVATQTIAGLEVVSAPAPLSACDLALPHPRIWLTPARLAAARARDRTADPAARRFYSATDGVDYFLAAMDQIPDVLSSAFESAVYDPESYIPALALCSQLAQGSDDARATRCAEAATALAVNIAHQYDSGARSFGRDTGYDIRFGLMQIMLAYDWLYDRLTTDERALIVRIGTSWIDWYAQNGYANTHPHENYYAGYLQGLALTTVATAGDNPATDRLLTLLNQRLYWEMPILDQRICGGDWPEGWNYGPYSLTEFSGVHQLLRDLGADWSPLFDFVLAEPTWLTYQMSPDFSDLVSFGGYSGNLPHKTSPALLAILSAVAPPAQATLAARLYTTGLAAPNNDFSDGTRGFTFWEMLFANLGGTPDLGALPLSYLATGTGRFASKSSLTDAAAYHVTAEAMSYFYDHYGYANGDVRLYKGGACLLCPAAYRGDAFAGEATTAAFSTYLVNGAEQRSNGRNNQVTFYKEATGYAALGMRFESSYASSRYDENVIDDANPLDHLIREVVHVRPGTLVVRDLHRRRHAADTLTALWHLGSSSTPQPMGAGQYRLDSLSIGLFGAAVTPVFTADSDERGARIGTLVTVDVPSSTAPLELVTVFSDETTATSYTGGVLTLANGKCVHFASGTVTVAPCP